MFLFVVARDLIVTLFTTTYAASVPIFMVWALTILPSIFAVNAVLRVYAQTRFLLVMNLMRLAHGRRADRLVPLDVRHERRRAGDAGQHDCSSTSSASCGLRSLLHLVVRRRAAVGAARAASSFAPSSPRCPVLWLTRDASLPPIVGARRPAARAYGVVYFGLSYLLVRLKADRR